MRKRHANKQQFSLCATLIDMLDVLKHLLAEWWLSPKLQLLFLSHMLNDGWRSFAGSSGYKKFIMYPCLQQLSAWNEHFKEQSDSSLDVAWIPAYGLHKASAHKGCLAGASLKQVLSQLDTRCSLSCSLGLSLTFFAFCSSQVRGAGEKRLGSYQRSCPSSNHHACLKCQHEFLDITSDKPRDALFRLKCQR